ncbi:MAG: type II secretion system F family protein [Lentisphaeria bacterium]|nr:type II secretion system F family protein [Lentisphaeria bacterium]
MSLMISIFAGISAWAAFTLVVINMQKVNMAAGKGLSKPLPLLFKIFLPFAPLAYPLVNRKFCDTMRLTSEERLIMAGYDEVLSARDFVALRAVFLVVGAVFVFLSAGSTFGFLSAAIGVMLMLFPGLWLSGTIKKRHESIMKALPNVLDLLTLSIESGRDLLSSLRDILARRQMDPLGEELNRTFNEIQLGRQRSEALRALAKRVKQVDLSATVNAIVQAEEFGISIGQLLRIQGDMQRNKRFAMAEKLANEASVKIIIPVVLCILPAVFIVLMGPLLFQALRMFQ